MKKVTSSSLRTDIPALVGGAMDVLATTSLITGRAPDPQLVEKAITAVADKVGTDLSEEAHTARGGCRRLSTQIDVKDAELRAVRQAARGNAVLLRSDGFSKPLEIAPCGYGYGSGPELPPYLAFYDCPEPLCGALTTTDIATRLRTRRYLLTSRKDGFGRAIYEQVG